MAAWRLLMALAAMVALIGAHVADADCNSELLSLTPCLPYVSGGDPGTPSKQCCDALAAVVKTDAICLCQLLTYSYINKSQALALPGECNVTTPPLSECPSAAAAPAPATSTDPALAVAPSIACAPATAVSPSKRLEPGLVPSVGPSPSSLSRKDFR